MRKFDWMDEWERKNMNNRNEFLNLLIASKGVAFWKWKEMKLHELIKKDYQIGLCVCGGY